MGLTYMLSNFWGVSPNLDIAKKVMTDYILVGLTDRFEESISRFEKYFGWCQPCDEHGNSERNTTLHGEHANSNKHEKLAQTDRMWKKIADMLKDDMELYEYGIPLFGTQKQILSRNL